MSTSSINNMATSVDQSDRNGRDALRRVPTARLESDHNSMGSLRRLPRIPTTSSSVATDPDDRFQNGTWVDPRLAPDWVDPIASMQARAAYLEAERQKIQAAERARERYGVRDGESSSQRFERDGFPDDHDQSFVDQSVASSSRPASGRTEFVSKRNSAYSENSKRNSAYSENSKRASAYSEQSSCYPESSVDSRRTSQASTINDGGPVRKTHIGPWELGRTLGKGSSARVRMGRHCVTGQEVAIKIITKDTAKHTQAGSIANLSALIGDNPVDADGNQRLPLSLEREVAILKLIEHDNITKLYDVWESNNEIYLIMEFVEGGDLFGFINKHGALNEDMAIWIFRQIMNAMQHCHEYKICHRDLKPENVLVKDGGKVKVADFSMAAIHQTPEHLLQTSCGSPHYAAPELLRGEPYYGPTADIWSMGVILFAILGAALPFCDDDMDVMLNKACVGDYHMPSRFSPDAKDLIRRMLNIDPAKRITMREMWAHPLIWKYSYLDHLDSIEKLPNVRAGKNYTPLTIESIDEDIFQQVAAMYHEMPMSVLVTKLCNSEDNDEKLFYHLLHDYREEQLENYNPGLTTSPSDNHILRPKKWTRKISTKAFSQPNTNGHGRSFSTFTVISNIAASDTHTDATTFASYDPYNSSLNMNTLATHAKITVHRNMSKRQPSIGTLNSRFSSVARRHSSMRRRGSYVGPAGRLRVVNGTMSSIQSSRQGTVNKRRSYRRGVDFSGVRKSSIHSKRMSFDSSKAPASIAGDETTYGRAQGLPPSPNRHKCSPGVARIVNHLEQPSPKFPKEWSAEMLQFSSSIAKGCDAAFGNSLLDTSPIQEGESTLPTQLTLTLNLHKPTPATPAATPGASTRPWDSRPLPPTPPGFESPSERAQHKGKGKAIAFADQVAAINAAKIRNVPPQLHTEAIMTPTADRRTISAPVYAQFTRGYQQMSPMGMQPREQDQRSVSAPTPSHLPTPPPTLQKYRGLDYLARASNTIRVVQSPTAMPPRFDPDATPRPLNVRKKLTKATNGNGKGKELLTVPVEPNHSRQYSFDSNHQANVSGASNNSSEKTVTPPKRKFSWFKRSSRSDLDASSTVDTGTPNANLPMASRFTNAPPPARHGSQSTAELPSPPPKKKGFNLAGFFKNSRSGSNPKLSLAGPGYADQSSFLEHAANISSNTAFSRMRANHGRMAAAVATGLPYEDENSATRRNISPHRTWLAKFFHIKPATRYLCLGISSKRARQEVAILLREWRRYGMKDIEVDKERNIVFARVGATNYLQIKEVAFAVEIMTVIEHGKRNHLSILRFTQEKGAASSFHRVVDTMSNVFRSRCLEIADKRKAKMMVKTLTS